MFGVRRKWVPVPRTPNIELSQGGSMSAPYLSVVTAGVGSSANAAMAGAHRAGWHTAEDDARLQRCRRFVDFDNGKHDVGRLGFGQAPVVANYARVFVRKGA